MKTENMLQRLSCISFLFKPPCWMKRRVSLIFYQNSSSRKLNRKILKSSSLSRIFSPGDPIGNINWLKHVLDLGVNANESESSDSTKRIEGLRSKPGNGSSSVPVVNLKIVSSVMFPLLPSKIPMPKTFYQNKFT